MEPGGTRSHDSSIIGVWYPVVVVACLSPPFALGQVVALQPRGQPIELVDSEERISGNAVTGMVLLLGDFGVGEENLWTYLPNPVPSAIQLSISSIDGRYFAEIEYDTSTAEPGWNPMGISLEEFYFLERYQPSNEQVAALVSDLDDPLFYPAWWGPEHSDVESRDELPSLVSENQLRVYMNTERARAFVVVDERPSFCSDASAVSGFKFNALCDVPLGEVVLEQRLDVHRRAGTRALRPIELNVDIEL